MLISHIKHFLNDEGIKYFPSWFKNIGDAMIDYPGFISADFAYDLENQNCIHIWVKFFSEEELIAWAKSPIHDKLISQLNPYRTQNYEVKRYIVSGSK